ncbi:MAG: hypothetical protein CME64_17470 [Halobacteriovoraceae bacterium]|nr:hypothetical protein [Halobacteriovoraceae bacterium]|tara:strand:- start:331831 stop:333102 length:1272 start_codon:yes stop_codon:yes gene_type:complete
MKYLLLLICGLANAFEYQGQIDFEHRQFNSDGDSDSHDSQSAIFLSLVSSKQLTENLNLNFGLKAREAFVDHERDFLNLDDTNISFTKNNWKASVGTHVFNWSVLEFFSAFDPINPLNLSQGQDVERLGLPSLVYTYEFESSFVQFINITRSIPSMYPQGRDRQGLMLDLETPLFVEDENSFSNGDKLFQFILRYKKSFDYYDWDFFIAQKYDTANPLLILEMPGAISPTINDLKLRPYYLQVRQVSTSLQTSYKEWLLKLEASHYDYKNTELRFFIPPMSSGEISQPDHSRVAFGAEKEFFHSNNHSTNFLLEYISILGVSSDEAKTLGPFQRDVLIGARHLLNNFNSHQFSLFITYDAQSFDEFIYTASHEFRISSAWKLEYGLTVFDTPLPDQNNPLDRFYGLKPVRESDNIMVTLSRYF